MVPRNQPLRSELAKARSPLSHSPIGPLGNLQQWLIGTYHGVSKDNSRSTSTNASFGIIVARLPRSAFQALLSLGTGRKSPGYEQIRGARAKPLLSRTPFRAAKRSSSPPES